MTHSCSYGREQNYNPTRISGPMAGPLTTVEHHS